MKRDMDLVRKILFKMEEDEDRTSFKEGSLALGAYSPEKVKYHMRIMAQAGFLHTELINTPMPSKQGRSNPPTQINCYSITWNGYEFLETARDVNRWKKS